MASKRRSESARMPAAGGIQRASAAAATAAAALGAVLLAAAAWAGNAPEPEEMAARDRWLAERVLRPVAEPGAPGAVPAFSFRFGGEPSEKLLAAWPRAREETELPRGRNRHTIAWRDPASNLEVRQVAVAYEDFPALEWTVYVRNAGERDSAPNEVSGSSRARSSRTSSSGRAKRSAPRSWPSSSGRDPTSSGRRTSGGAG